MKTYGLLGRLLRNRGAPHFPHGATAADKSAGGVPSTNLSDYEVSPMRWAFDAMLAEYTALREEIRQIKDQMDRTYAYLLALIGAIFASQLLSRSTEVALARHSTFYLIAALLSLWFPANNLCMAMDMNSLGAYMREVLLPKLNAIVRTAVESASASPANADMLTGWSSTVAQILPQQLRPGLNAPMAWEEFLPRVRLGPRRQQLVLAPIYSARSLLLYAPTGLLIGLFAIKVHNISAEQLCLLVLIGVFLVAAAIANVTIAGLVTFAMQRGPFKHRHD